VLALGPAAASVSAEDWLQFRGADGQGHSSATGLPTRWSATENVRWKTAVPGEGWSSPIASGKRIFLTAAVPAGPSHSLHALALEADGGAIAWDTEIFDKLVEELAQMHPKNSHASPTGIVDGKRLFVHFGAHGTACLSCDDGQILWKTRAIAYHPQHGSGGSPVLVDGVLVYSCDGVDVQFVVGLDARTGAVRWKQPRPACDEPKRFAFSTPLVIEVGGETQVVSPAAHGAVAYDPQTGRERWRVRYSGYSVVPRPVYGLGLVFITTSYDSSSMLAVRPDGHGDVTDSHVAWKQSKAMPYTPSPLLVEDELYLVNDAGIASCLDARTGRSRWMHRIGGKFSASPLVAEGRIYVQSEEGVTTIFQADRDRYVEVAANKLGERTLASPAVIDESLLIRTAQGLYRIENR
jgi:outer membrane protein assembly factor BamB